MSLFPQCTVPEGASGDWRVERFTVAEDEAKRFNTRLMFQPGMGGRTVQPGEYTRLMRGRTVVMSDTPAELRDHVDPVLQAKGDCLINGLGLGIVLSAVLLRNDVESVTVVERSPDVIELVCPQFQFDDRVEIVQADAYEWKPPKGTRYGMVWHDIWDNICGDNWPEMGRLHRKYGRRADWQGSWCRDECYTHR